MHRIALTEKDTDKSALEKRLWLAAAPRSQIQSLLWTREGALLHLLKFQQPPTPG
jgi:hypothetical protein